MRIVNVVGARPNFMKMAPLMAEYARHADDFAPVLVHTEFLRAGASESRPIAVLLLVICLWVFVMLQFGQTLLPFALKRQGGGGRP